MQVSVYSISYTFTLYNSSISTSSVLLSGESLMSSSIDGLIVHSSEGLIFEVWEFEEILIFDDPLSTGGSLSLDLLPLPTFDRRLGPLFGYGGMLIPGHRADPIR